MHKSSPLEGMTFFIAFEVKKEEKEWQEEKMKT